MGSDGAVQPRPLIYLSGPMRGRPNYNYDLFNTVAYELRSQGHGVFNPAQEHGGEQGLPWETYMRHDLGKLMSICGSIAVLPGWRNSVGASIELLVALSLGYPVYEVVDPSGPSLHLSELAVNPEDVLWADPPPGVFPDGGVVLDLSDPFERVIGDMIATNRRKRADYASDDDPFSNFRATAAFAGFEQPWLSALFNCSQKLARIQSLRMNGRLTDPKNEAVYDTVLDNAVYAVIALSMASGGE